MKVHQTFLTVLFAPMVGALVYLWSIDQFEVMADAPTSGIIGFVFASWVVALLITLIIGFPLGFATAALLRRVGRESLWAYLAIAISLALLLAILLGDLPIGLGFVVTASLLAFGYWFGVAKPRIENSVA